MSTTHDAPAPEVTRVEIVDHVESAFTLHRPWDTLLSAALLSTVDDPDRASAALLELRKPAPNEPKPSPGRNGEQGG